MKIKEEKTIFYEINGSHSEVNTVKSVIGGVAVASVTTVAKVPLVANNPGINATNVTIEQEHRRATPFQFTSCDKSDKRDSCDNPVKICGITESIDRLARQWEQDHHCSITSMNLKSVIPDIQQHLPDATSDEILINLERYAKVPPKKSETEVIHNSHDNITQLEHIKKVIRSYEETINDKRPLEGRDKQPFINWYFKQNGNTISASDLWGIVAKEKAFTPETKPAWQIQPEQSRITVEVCGEVSEVVVE